VALLTDFGRETASEALERTRRPRGDWMPRTLELLAARLERATVERLLSDDGAIPRLIGTENAPGLEGLLRRLRALAGEGCIRRRRAVDEGRHEADP